MVWLWTSHHHFLFGCPYAVDSYLSGLDRHGKNSSSYHCLHHIKDILYFEWHTIQHRDILKTKWPLTMTLYFFTKKNGIIQFPFSEFISWELLVLLSTLLIWVVLSNAKYECCVDFSCPLTTTSTPESNKMDVKMEALDL